MLFVMLFSVFCVGGLVVVGGDRAYISAIAVCDIVGGVHNAGSGVVVVIIVGVALAVVVIFTRVLCMLLWVRVLVLADVLRDLGCHHVWLC